MSWLPSFETMVVPRPLHGAFEDCGTGLVVDAEAHEDGQEALERGTSVHAPPTVPSPGPASSRGAPEIRRSERALADASAAESAARRLSALGDPLALLRMLQSRLRDVQLGQREEDVRSAGSRADVHSAARASQLARAEDAERDRAQSDELGEVFKYIGVGLALVAGAVSAAFTGGVGLVAAVGLAVAVLGPIVCDVLRDERVIDGQAALWASVTCAAVGAALSFGAGAVGGATAAASAVAQTVTQVSNVAVAAAKVAQGGCQIASGVFTGEHMHRLADANDAGQRVQQSLAALDESADSIRALTEQFGRVARRMREVSEVEAEGRRAAASFRA